MRIGHQGAVVAAPRWCGLVGSWNGGVSSGPRRSRGALEWTPLTLDAHWLIYHPPKPSPDGRTELILSPLERIGSIAALVPPRGNPVCSRPARRYARRSPPWPPSSWRRRRSPRWKRRRTIRGTLCRSPSRYLWAMLLARIYETLPLTCPGCGAEMRIIAFITASVDARRILEHSG